MVREFHETFGLEMALHPTIDVPAPVATIRRKLVEEETAELLEALEGDDIVSIAREIADLVYVLYGMALTYGINLDATIAAVHSANMSKMSPDGGRRLRSDGKVLKGQNYRPPDIRAALTSNDTHAHVVE